MLRLSLAARITMIVVIALAAAWIAAIAQFYRSHDRGEGDALPPPRRIAALVRLVEQGTDRVLVLASVASNTLYARVEAGATLNDIPNGARPVAEVIRQGYETALGDRDFTLVSKPLPGRLFPRLMTAATNAYEFRVALKAGETLVVDTRNPVAVTRLGLPVGFGAGLFGTLVALVALIIMHRETRPLARLAAAVDRMDLGAPVALPRARTNAPEIQALIAAFNRLQSRLSELLRARMAMLGGISHDVRTFATRLRLRVEQLPEGTERERAIGDISDMIRLLDDALLASRAGVGENNMELVEFADIVRAEVEDRRTAGAAIDLRGGTDGCSTTVLGDRVALRRVVANLADNALKYGRAAHVSVAADAATVTLTVDDEGPGIPADQRNILLEPFVRLETSRNRVTGGAGLGLAVVASLVEAHSGTIEIGEAPGGGARFVVRVPVFRASDAT